MLESEGKGYVMALSGKAYVERKPIKKWIEETTSSGWRIIRGDSKYKMADRTEFRGSKRRSRS